MPDDQTDLTPALYGEGAPEPTDVIEVIEYLGYQPDDLHALVLLPDGNAIAIAADLPNAQHPPDPPEEDHHG